MQMMLVKSTNVHSIGHDGEHTYVTFKDKAGNPVSTYRYANVSAEKHAAFAGAESVGKHLNEHLKGQHDATKLDAVHAAPAEAA